MLTRAAGDEPADEVETVTLWRADLDGEATEVVTMDGSGWWLETNGTEVFVVSSGCPDGEAGCDPVGVARVWVASGAEVVVDGLEVGRTDEPGNDVAAHTVGTAGPDVWVGAGPDLLRVSPTGEVVESVARGDAGLVCAVDGRLVATSHPAIPTPADGAPPGLIEPTGSTLDVMTSNGSQWETVSTVSLGPDEDLRCTPSGLEAFSFQAPATPLAFWAPGRDEFEPVDAEATPPAIAAGLTPLVTHHGEVAIVSEEGQVLVRPPGTTGYTARPSARVVEGVAGWKLPDYDASLTVEVSCTTETSDESSPVTCEVAER